MERQSTLAFVLLILMFFAVPSSFAAGSHDTSICSSSPVAGDSGGEFATGDQEIILAQMLPPGWGQRCQCFNAPFRCFLPYPEPLDGPCYCFRCGDGFVVR